MAQAKPKKTVRFDWRRIGFVCEMPDASPSTFGAVAEFINDSGFAVVAFDEDCVEVTKNEAPTTKPKKAGRRRNTTRKEAEEVFAYYCEKMNRPRLKFLRDRQRRIQGYLAQGYTVDELKLAIDGILLSPVHTGQNESNAEYLEVSNVFKSPDHVDKFIRLATGTRTVKRDAASSSNPLERFSPPAEKPASTPRRVVRVKVSNNE